MSSQPKHHDLDACYFNGEYWQVICSCGWEGWNLRDERRAREFHKAHVRTPLLNVPREALAGDGE